MEISMKAFRHMLLAVILLSIISLTGCSPKAEIPMSTIDVNVGDEISIPIEYLTENKYNVEVESTDEGLLIKTGDNNFVANAEGSVVVQLKHGNKVIDSCRVAINIPVKRAKFANESITVNVGDRFDLFYSVMPENATCQEFELKSDNRDCLIEQDDGSLLAKAAGVVTVTLCQGENNYDTCEVVINNVPAEVISFEEKEIEVYIGRSTELPVVFTPWNATFKDVAINASNVNCLDIEETESPNIFTLKGRTAGTVTLTAITPEGLKASIRVKVVPVLLESLSADVGSREMLIGKTGRVTYALQPDDVTDQAVSFRSSNSRVLTVDQEGNLKAVGVGTATITVSHNKSKLTETIEIVVKPIEVTSVSVSGNDFSLYPNETKQLSATVRPSDATYPKVTWSSSNTAVATVSNSGVVTARKAGTATITAKTENGKSDSVRVTVKSTTKRFTVTITATCRDYNSVGNEWGEYFYVNNQQVSSGTTVSITMDRTTTIQTKIIEYDSINDVGTSTYSFVVPKNYFESGFYATQTVNVRENRGRYSGNVATWDIKYSFRPS